MIGRTLVMFVLAALGSMAMLGHDYSQQAQAQTTEWVDAGGGLQYRDAGAYRCFRMSFATTLSCVVR